MAFSGKSGDKRVLILSMRYPEPPCSGEKVTLYNYLRAFGELDYAIDLIALSEKSRLKEFDRESLKGKIKGLDLVEIVPVTALTGVWGALLALLKGLPLQVGYFNNRNTRKQIEKLLAVNGKKYSQVLFHTVRTAGLIESPRETTTILFSDAISRHYRLASPFVCPAIRQVQTLESRLLEKYEKKMIQSASLSIFHSQLDVDYLGIHSKEVEIIPVSKDILPFFQPITDTTRKRFLLIGQFSYHPNRDAIGFLIHNRKKIEEMGIRIDLVGSGLKKRTACQILHSPNIRFLGFIDSLEEEILDSYGIICPVRFGAGMQNKILDAIVNGRPSVSTAFTSQPYYRELESKGVFSDCLLSGESDDQLLHLMKRLLSDRNYANEISRKTYEIAGFFHRNRISQVLEKNRY